MARPLRILVPGGWYHVTSRGNRQEPIYLSDEDRRRFLSLVAEWPERFGIEVHAFVLMDNHYHLVVRTPEPNLSDAVRWLHVNYTCRFNWAHRQSGHLFQGRFKSILIEEFKGVVAVARYVHLNPVRVESLGLGKAEQKRARAVGGADPGAATVVRRLTVLREYAWSSWRCYQGAEAVPKWLDTSVIGPGCGGRSRKEQRQALSEYTEAPIRQGRWESPWTGLVGGVVLGSREFAQGLLKGLKKGRGADLEEQTAARKMSLVGRVGWEELVRAAEAERGMAWREMAQRWGEWGRDGTMYVAVRHGRQRLADVVRAIGDIRYGAAAQAVRRFGAGLEKDRSKRRFVESLKRRLGS